MFDSVFREMVFCHKHGRMVLACHCEIHPQDNGKCYPCHLVEKHAFPVQSGNKGA